MNKKSDLKVFAFIAAVLLIFDISSSVILDKRPEPAVEKSIQTMGTTMNMNYAVTAEAFIFHTETPTVVITAEPSPTPTLLNQMVAVEDKIRKYSKSEKILIARVVYGESRGEPFKGQVAVAVVVINRYESGIFGKTVRRVVYAKNQFSVGGRYTKQNMKAVETAIKGTDFPKKMFYFQRSKSRHWGRLVYYCRIGNHSFYLAR